MKSTKIEVKAVKKYPWIGISDIAIVVLFTAPKTGVVLHQESHKLGTNREIGEYVSGTICEENFTTFTGTITLSN